MRLNPPQARLPSRAALADALREKERGRKAPGCLAGLFFVSQSYLEWGAAPIRGFLPSRFVLSFLPAALCLIGACFCASMSAQTPAPASAAAASPSYKEVIDEAGRTVRVPQPVQRIVSLSPSTTETLYALGLQDRLVGDTDYCDFPPDARKKTKVGGAINPSIEEIVALRPDLVLVTKLNRLETVNALSELGISSYAVDPHTVEQIISSTRRLAHILGVPEAGAAVATDLDRQLGELHQRLSAYPPTRVLFVVWSDPLISIGKNTFIADALRLAGATSIVNSSQDWPQVSLEEVARLQPDYLVFAESHSEAARTDFEALAERPGWRGLTAVRNRRYAVISDAVNRPAPRIVSAIADLARQLHPDAFSGRSPATPEQNNLLPHLESSLHSHELLAGTLAFREVCACAL